MSSKMTHERIDIALHRNVNCNQNLTLGMGGAGYFALQDASENDSLGYSSSYNPTE